MVSPSIPNTQVVGLRSQQRVSAEAAMQDSLGRTLLRQIEDAQHRSLQVCRGAGIVPHRVATTVFNTVTRAEDRDQLEQAEAELALRLRFGHTAPRAGYRSEGGEQETPPPPPRTPGPPSDVLFAWALVIRRATGPATPGQPAGAATAPGR